MARHPHSSTLGQPRNRGGDRRRAEHVAYLTGLSDEALVAYCSGVLSAVANPSADLVRMVGEVRRLPRVPPAAPTVRGRAPGMRGRLPEPLRDDEGFILCRLCGKRVEPTRRPGNPRRRCYPACGEAA